MKKKIQMEKHMCSLKGKGMYHYQDTKIGTGTGDYCCLMKQSRRHI